MLQTIADKENYKRKLSSRGITYVNGYESFGHFRVQRLILCAQHVYHLEKSKYIKLKYLFIFMCSGVIRR